MTKGYDSGAELIIVLLEVIRKINTELVMGSHEISCDLRHAIVQLTSLANLYQKIAKFGTML